MHVDCCSGVGRHLWLQDLEVVVADLDLRESLPCHALVDEVHILKHGAYLPFCAPAIMSAFCLTAAVSFDEFAVAWFVSGLTNTGPVIILEILQGNTDPRINAIGSVVFVTSMSLVILAQIIYMRKSSRRSLTGI